VPAQPDAAANSDLLALAAAASHAFVSPRATGGGAKGPVAPAPAPAPAVPAQAASASGGDAAPVSVRSADGAGYVPFGLDDGGVMEPGSAPGRPPLAQSGRTVPLSAALLASVVKSVEDKRAAAGGGAPAPIEAPPPPKKRSALALALILAIGFGVFITGVVMFLDAMK
jgi:hypothetical protein